MRAAIIDRPLSMRVGEWERPRPGTGEVVVEVRATGVCAGDLYIYLGKNPYASYPQVGGHEIAGVVAEVGGGVEGFPHGTEVVVEPFLGCGRCYPCRIGKSNCCARLQIIGVHHPGGFAEYVKAPASSLHRVPEGLSLPDASFAEPVAIAVQACRRGSVAAGEEVLVLGCGPIGLALVEVIRARGARALASDLVASRMELARRLGAETLDVGPGLTEAVLERTAGEGMPVVMEATGSPQAMEQAAELVAPGGRVVIVGLVKQGTRVSFPGLDFTRKEMTILGSRASVSCFPESLDLLRRGAITYPRVASRLALEEAPAIFARLAEDPTCVHKAVLVPERM